MKDMTQGNPVKEVLLFSVPMILASVFQQMYNAVDSIIVGQFVGANALAAVGAAFPAMFLAMSVLIGITMGVQIIISQLFGAREHERMRATFATSIISLMILVVIASVIGYFASGTILELMNTPPEIIADSKAYLDEIFKGLIFMFLYNLYTSVLRGVGDSKTPLYFLIISSILNIVLDLVYVIQFGMGVRGVAVATVQSQAVSVILCIIYTNIRIPLFRLGLKDLTRLRPLFHRRGERGRMPQHSTSFVIYFVIELPRYRAVASGSQPLGAKKLTFLSASLSVTHWECMLSPSRQVVRSPSSASMRTTFAVETRMMSCGSFL